MRLSVLVGAILVAVMTAVPTVYANAQEFKGGVLRFQ